MKLDFDPFLGAFAAPFAVTRPPYAVRSETDRLTDVLMCPPHFLAPVPCCAVTRRSLSHGFVASIDEAQRQHAELVRVLQRSGVRCHMLTPDPTLPDMCFSRDVGVSTPWGMVALNPAMLHRRPEVDRLIQHFGASDALVRNIRAGTIEGGDICVAREGLLLIGMSGERSTAAGINDFSAPFRAAGWEVLICPFHADNLHLDTIFCMVDRDEAIACVDLLDPGFLAAVRARGVSIIAVPDSAASTLDCNILSLGDRHIVARTDGIVAPILRAADYDVTEVDISQFAACGGGIHCLTQPLRRATSSERERSG